VNLHDEFIAGLHGRLLSHRRWDGNLLLFAYVCANHGVNLLPNATTFTGLWHCCVEAASDYSRACTAKLTFADSRHNPRSTYQCSSVASCTMPQWMTSATWRPSLSYVVKFHDIYSCDRSQCGAREVRGVTVLQQQLEGRIRREVPHLSDVDVHALACIVERLVEAYQPERMYLFGSKARGDAGPDSDFDVMLVVPDEAQVECKESRLAYKRLWGTGIAADVLVWSHQRFESRTCLRASLPGTIIREGKLLYAA